MTVRVLLIGMIAAAVACGKEAAARAVFTQTNLDFGTVIEGTPLEPEFVVKNAGDAPLRIERVNMTAPVKVLVKKMPAQIAPGAEAVIRLSIDTNAGLGPVDGEVVVMLNDPAQPEAHLGLQGRIVGRIEVTPAGALYVAAGQGERAEGSVEIINHEAEPFTIEGVEHRVAGRFTTRLDTLDAGRRYKLTLFLDGNGEKGRHRDAITLKTTSRTTPEFKVVANTLVRESVYAFPDVVDFGKFPVALLRANPAAAARVAQTVMVYQKGGNDFRMDVTSDLPNVEVKSERGPAGDRYQLTVTLVGEKSQAGPVRGSLHIRTNDPDVPTLSVPVSGQLLP